MPEETGKMTKTLFNELVKEILENAIDSVECMQNALETVIVSCDKADENWKVKYGDCTTIEKLQEEVQELLETSEDISERLNILLNKDEE